MMRIRHVFISLTAGLVLLAVCLLLLSRWPAPMAAAQPSQPILPAEPALQPAAPNAEWRVCPAGPPTCDYASIQAAVDAAQPGDIIKIAAGRYTDVHARIQSFNTVTQVVYISKTITLQGGYTITNWTAPNPEANPTILDAQGKGRVIYISGNIAPTIDGLHVTGGMATTAPGGGMVVANAAAVIRNCQIYSNTAASGSGGGAYLSYSAATLSHNIIAGNTASSGGGVYLSNSSAVLEANIITTNTATFAGGGGGGVYLYSSPATLNANTLTANTASGNGGGLYLERSNATLDNNLVARNQAGSNGSGICIKASAPRLRHTTLASNSGGDGTGLYATNLLATYSNVVLTNTIIVGHNTGVRVTMGSQAALQATLWGADLWANLTDWSGPVVTGSINLWANPLFINPPVDYHIDIESPAIDSGVNAGVLTDIDGEPRPASMGFDLGADEAPGPVLQLGKTIPQPAFNAGQVFTYTIRVFNPGQSSASVVMLTDTLPLYQQPLLAISGQGDCTVNNVWGGQVVCNLNDIPAMNGARITLTVQLTDTLRGPLPFRMRNTLEAQGSNVIAVPAFLDMYVHDCHVRINGAAPEYTHLQPAIDAARDGDVLMIAGLCVGVAERNALRQTAYLARSLTLRGGYSPDFAMWNPSAYPTYVDALGEGRTFYIAGGIQPTIEWLHIRGGNAAGLGGSYDGKDAGGGVYLFQAAATISQCHIYSNTAQRGGGLYLSSSPATLESNIITSNTASSGGGGAFLYQSNATLNNNSLSGNIAIADAGGGLRLLESDAVLTGNTISGNQASSGGGVYLYTSAANLNNNNILDNRATTGSGGGLILGSDSPAMLNNNTIANNLAEYGGGLVIWSAAPPTLVGNQIISNTATQNGGGVEMSTCSAILSNNSIQNNRAGRDGGGIWASSCSITFTANLIQGNRATRDGGGIRFYGSNGVLGDNTIAQNTADRNGGGMYLRLSSPAINGNTVARNLASIGGGLYITRCAALTLTNNIVAQNVVTTTGNGLWAGMSNGWLRHNTIADNGENGVGVQAVDEATLHLVNTIIAGHGVGITVTDGSQAVLSYTLWYSNTIANISSTGQITSSHAITGDPAFVGGGNYHITPDSAAVDAGADAGVFTDIDGEHRPQGVGFDIGADEISLTEIGPDGGWLIYTDTRGLTTTLFVPPGALTSPVVLNYTPLDSPPQPPLEGHEFAGDAFELDAYRNGTRLENFSFLQAVTLTIHYADADVAGMDEDTLRLYRLVPLLGWQKVGTRPGESQTLDAAHNTLVARLRGLSKWGKMGVTSVSGGSTIYLPVVLRNR